MSNKNLNLAQKVKNDEFYTLYEDVEKGIEPYRDYFKGKTVFCNCNDGKQSNFYKFFKENFKSLELSRLICTSYKRNGNGECFELFSFPNGYGEIEYKLEGDGDFRSQESIDILDTVDIVVTNPPFSLFREFINLLETHNKKYLVLGNLNTMISKDIFHLIKEEKAWVVPRHTSMKFMTRNEEIL